MTSDADISVPAFEPRNRLLQRRASWRTDRHRRETAASSEQCSSDCVPSIECIRRQAVTAPATLVASPATDHIQVGSSDVQSSEHVHSSLPERPNHERVCSRALRSAVIPLLVQPFTRTKFPRRAFRYSAPSVWSSLPQTVLVSDCVSVSKSRLKTFLFTQAFTEH